MKQGAQLPVRLGAALVALIAGCAGAAAQSKQPCLDDAMIVFDASKSMAASIGDEKGLRRIDVVRSALADVLPRVAPRRRMGLITYGPGTRDACSNVFLQLKPMSNAATKIMSRVDALKPEGRTPLTRAVRGAAEVLDFRNKAATIIVLTDGEETCGADPCALARELKREGAGTVVHVISYEIASAVGSDGEFVSRCFADETGGTYVDTKTIDQVRNALETALSCPLISDARDRMAPR